MKKLLWLLALSLSASALLAGCRSYEYASGISEQSGKTSVIILEEEDEVPYESEGSEGLTLLFAGDIYLSDYVTEAYRNSGISGVVDEGYRQEIAQTDIFFANEEFPFSDRGEAIEDKEYTYRVGTSYISLFRELGLDGVTLANNHVLDYGADALLDTCALLDQAGILHTGAGEDLAAAQRPAVFSANGKTVAIVGASRVTPDATWFASAYNPGVFQAYRPSVLIEQVRRLSADPSYDAVIAYIHWGIERDEMPQDYQRTLGRQLIDAGADLVIGAHPHVLQGIEYYNGRPIFYSLGNFIFGSSIPRTALLKVVWNEEGGPAFQLIPGSAAFGYTQMMNTDEKRQEFFRYIESISEGVVISDDGFIRPK